MDTPTIDALIAQVQAVSDALAAIKNAEPVHAVVEDEDEEVNVITKSGVKKTFVLKPEGVQA